MLNKNIVLDSIQQVEYQQILKEVKLQKAKDRNIIFDRMFQDFTRKYNLDILFFGENFFQNFIDAYRDLNKKAIEYFNESNREISKQRLEMLKKYGYQSDKEYRENVQFDMSREIIGLPNYLNPETSLRVIKKKYSDPFIAFYNEQYLKKVTQLVSMMINEIKEGKISFLDENGKNRIEVIINDFQNLMFSMIYLKLDSEEVISFHRIAYGRLTGEELKEALKQTLEYHDPVIMDYSAKQELSDQWGNNNIWKVCTDCHNEYKKMKKEYIHNKNVVLTYNQDHNYERVQNDLIPTTEIDYAYRLSITQALYERFDKRNVFQRMIALHEDYYYHRFLKLIPLRYIDKSSDILNRDFTETKFKSQKTLAYLGLCDEIEDAFSALGMLMQYTYDMVPANYDVHMKAQLTEIEKEYRLKYNLTEQYYVDLEDNLIREKFGPQYLEGYDANALENRVYDDTMNY